MDTESAVLDMTKGLTTADREALAAALRDALTALPSASGPLDANLRERFSVAADLLDP